MRIDEDQKRNLERFVASLRLDEDLKVTLQEAVGIMLDFSMEHRDEVVSRLKRLPLLEKDPAWNQLHDPDDWGVVDASERIDGILYG